MIRGHIPLNFPNFACCTKQKVVPRPAKGPTPCGPGLLQPGMVKSWGGDGGSTWDDGVFTGIKKIFLAKGEEAIYAIQIEYDRNGQSMWSVKHGSNNEGSSHVVIVVFR